MYESLDSSFLDGFEWVPNENDPNSGTLTIHFKNGKEYNYKDVPIETVEEFRDSSSAGKFYSSNIKGKFEEG